MADDAPVSPACHALPARRCRSGWTPAGRPRRATSWCSPRSSAGAPPRAPERVEPGLAEMIRFQALPSRRLRGRQRLRRAARRSGLPDDGRPAARKRRRSRLATEPRRLDNPPAPVALKRMIQRWSRLFCDSGENVPRPLSGRPTALRCSTSTAPRSASTDGSSSPCFLPMPIDEATTGKPVAVILRPGRTPDGAEAALVLRHLAKANYAIRNPLRRPPRHRHVLLALPPPPRQEPGKALGRLPQALEARGLSREP